MLCVSSLRSHKAKLVKYSVSDNPCFAAGVFNFQKLLKQTNILRIFAYTNN